MSKAAKLYLVFLLLIGAPLLFLVARPYSRVSGLAAQIQNEARSATALARKTKAEIAVSRLASDLRVHCLRYQRPPTEQELARFVAKDQNESLSEIRYENVEFKSPTDCRALLKFKLDGTRLVELTLPLEKEWVDSN